MNSSKFDILMATSEAVPFAKTGGLADVCGALPVELARLGHRPAVIMPAYRGVRESGVPVEATGVELAIPIGSKISTGTLLRSHLPDSEVPVYLVEQDEYYNRPQLYGVGSEDYIDNCERFVFFCRATLEAIRLLDLHVDVLHLNDWQTGLIPAYLNTEYRGVPGYEQIATILTIHNMAYQGQFWHWDMELTGIDWKYFNWQQMEFFGNLNLMKTGIVFADAINTVSPRYALEIQTAEQGCGMEGVLKHRSNVLSGIINGVDYSRWDPGIDPHITTNFGVDDVRQGKADCKAALQKELGLSVDKDVPIVGFIGRLAAQKGVDLLTKVMAELTPKLNLQWVILGSGDDEFQTALGALVRNHRGRIAVELGFSDPLAHRIEAGVDMFLMPSQYEPCGLNQLYSLRYGTVPIVRATGGLADTIVDANEATLQAGTANGFCFGPYSSPALAEALERACAWFENRKAWSRLQEIGMRQDWSWRRSAQSYVDLYRSTTARVRETIWS